MLRTAKKTYKYNSQINKNGNTKKNNIRNVVVTNEVGTPTQSKFISTSRLNRGQRKYCHCLMQVRSQNRDTNGSRSQKRDTNGSRSRKRNPYGICKNMSYKIMIKNRGQPAYRFKPNKTNCIMNYDYSQYSLADIQALAQERHIPLHNKNTGKLNAKSTLIQLLTGNYIKNHRQKTI